jgi:lipase maturation factor 1
MEDRIERAIKWLFAPEAANEKHPGHLWPRWIFLRALGVFYFSAFYSLLFQIKGLIGPNGILPAGDFLQAVSAAFHAWRFWFAPSLFWFGSSDHALMLVCWVGAIASLLLVANVWPRAALAVSFICFLSFVSASQDFSSYQSDGMILEAGFISLFFAPPGFWPSLARANPPSRASLYLLRWEWFCIYFGSGVGKMAGGDPSWRNFTAMDDYYQNGPLPTWIGWYVQHLPHWFHASAVFYTLAIELVLVLMLFLPRRFRIALFCIVTPFEISIILTANYAFLNYLVLFLGVLLLDDRVIEWIVPLRIRTLIDRNPSRSARERSGARGLLPSA